MGFSFFNMNFNALDGIKQALSAMEDLDFANNQVTCSNCGMTLREFENTGKLGCISCFNAFGNEINNRMLRLYGSEEYMGRQPGETIAYEYDDGVKTETSVPAETVPDRKEEKTKDMVFITTTDGNHGRGVAWAAHQYGCRSYVFMPKGSAQSRVDAIKRVGAEECTVTDMNYDDTVAYTARLAAKKDPVVALRTE